MSVDIPPELEQFVRHAIDEGAFESEAEMVGEALRLLQRRQRHLDELRQEVEPSLEQLDRGEGIQLDEESVGEFFDDVKERGRKRHEAGLDSR